MEATNYHDDVEIEEEETTPTMEDVIDATCYTQEGKQLFEAVIDQMGVDWEDIITYPMDYRDASAGVPGFIYYTETEKFAKDNLVNIISCLDDFEQEIGEPLKKDHDHLYNWYAWFALEHVIDKIACYKEQW